MRKSLPYVTALAVVLVSAVAASAWVDPPPPSNSSTSAQLAAQMPGCIEWLDPDVGVCSDTAGTTSVTNNGTVALWRDQSAFQNDAVQSTAGSRPTFHTGRLNGHPGITFTGDGATAGQALQTTIPLASGHDCWCVAVVSDGSVSWATRGTDTTHFYTAACWDGNEGGTTGTDFIPLGGASNDWPSNGMVALGNGYNAGSLPRAFGAVSPVLATGSYHVFAWILGAWSDCRIDGVSVASTRSPWYATSGTGLIDIGTSNSGFGSRFYNGDICEIVIGTEAIRPVQLRRLEHYLGAKYNIAVQGSPLVGVAFLALSLTFRRRRRALELV